uniref:Uncharacterized protein n=1 Tax=Rhizophora mucronata TaxID=61149 RepID=A0A2P2N831_RHIMU
MITKWAYQDAIFINSVTRKIIPIAKTTGEREKGSIP